MGWPEFGCRVLRVACCMLPPGAHALEARTHARKHPRAQAHTCKSRRFVGMAEAHEAVGARSRWSRLPYIRCTAAAPHPSRQSSAELQLEQIVVAGNAAEKSLLAEVTEKNPDASYIELLRLFKVRCRRRALVALVASGTCCIVWAACCSRVSARRQLPHRTRTLLLGDCSSCAAGTG